MSTGAGRVFREWRLRESECLGEGVAVYFSTGAERQLGDDVYFYGHHEAGKFLTALVKDLLFIQGPILNNSRVYHFTIEGVGYTKGSGFLDTGDFRENIINLCRGDFWLYPGFATDKIAFVHG